MAATPASRDGAVAEGGVVERDAGGGEIDVQEIGALGREHGIAFAFERGGERVARGGEAGAHRRDNSPRPCRGPRRPRPGGWAGW